MMDEIERVARAIAPFIADDFDNAFRDKPEWIDERGTKAGRFRDINEPFQGDYLAAAEAAIKTVRTAIIDMFEINWKINGSDPLTALNHAFDAALHRIGERT